MSDLNAFRTFAAARPAETTEDNLVSTLKQMLAEAYVLYHTIHGFHWNLKGSDFYEYHKFYDEMVDDIYNSIDPIAENIVKLGDVAPFVMSELTKLSKIKEVDLFSKNTKELTTKFHEMNEEFIAHIKEAFKVANTKNEQGIANFIAERIDKHQKWSWFLKASLGK